MAFADLYLDTIDYNRYISKSVCQKCGVDSCKDLIAKIKKREQISSISSDQIGKKIRLLNTVLTLEKNLPQVPQLALPRPGDPGLIPLNNPDRGDPILITTNSMYTQEILLTVLATSTKPFFFLSIDTHGDTLDMALILKSFTGDTIFTELQSHNLTQLAASSTVLLPGRAQNLAKPLADLSGMKVEVGPLCAVELPLYYGEEW